MVLYMFEFNVIPQTLLQMFEILIKQIKNAKQCVDIMMTVFNDFT